jgi:hypothetical protein
MKLSLDYYIMPGNLVLIRQSILMLQTNLKFFHWHKISASSPLMYVLAAMLAKI